jgi:AcrR family transcriptional regulator
MVGRSGPRGEYAKSQRRREEILAAGFAVFSANGYLNSSMSQIAKRAGMTMPGVSYYFPSKALLLEAVLSERDLDAARHLQGRRGVDLMRGLVEIAARDEVDLDLTQLFTVLAAEATKDDHPAHDYFQQRYRLILDNVHRAFEDARLDGHLRAEVDPSEAATMYAALSDGFQLQRLYGVAASSQTQLVTQFFNNLLSPAAQLRIEAPLTSR